MKQKIPESWLSGYLDGELTSKELAAVEKAIRNSRTIARRLEEMRKVVNAVRSLPVLSLDSATATQIWSAWRSDPRVRNAAQQCVSAYHDDELSPGQRRAFARRLSDEPKLRPELDDLDIHREALAGLPKFTCPEGLLDRVIARLKADEQSVDEALKTLPVTDAPEDLLQSVVAKAGMQPIAPSKASTTSRFFQRSSIFVLGVAIALVVTVISMLPMPANHLALGTNRVDANDQPLFDPIEVVFEDQWQDELGGMAAGRAPLPGRDKLVEPHLMPDPPKIDLVGLTDEPLRRLEGWIQPGQQITLDGSKLTFVCVNVEEMFDRLRIVLIRHSMHPEGKRDGEMISVEIAATPNQLTDVLARLRDAEDSSRLIAAVEVSVPAKQIAMARPNPQLDDLKKDLEKNLNPPSKSKKDGAASKKTVAQNTSKEQMLPLDAPRKYLFVFRPSRTGRS